MMRALRQGLTRFLHDPMGAMEDMRDAVPTAPVAAMALMAVMLVHGIIDHFIGVYAFPHTLEEGGKRSYGPVISTTVFVGRIFATASILWIGGRLLFKVPETGALAMWMTLPFALSELVMDGVELLTLVFFLLTDVSIYGQMFMIAFIGQILLVILSVRVMFPDRDWLSCLPLGMAAVVGGAYLFPIILPIAGFYLLLRRLT